MAPEPTDVDSQNLEEQNQIESTLALIKPDCLTPHRIQAIKDLVQLAGFELVRQKKFWFTRESASEFYLEHKDKAFFEDLISYITCAPVMAFELRQNDAVQIWRKLLGPTDPEVARETDVNSIRAMFGVDITKNAVHGSDSVESAQREIEFVFSNSIHTMVSDSKEHGDDTLFKSEYTLGIIKPDAVSSGHSDTILRAINYKGFEVLNFEKLHLSEQQVKEFYQDQKSKPFYQELVSFMTSGEVHVILLKGINAIRGWREMMGPADVEVARITRPQSIRALYGTDEVKNAIHGSESKETANREITFFFPNFFDSLSTGVENNQTPDALVDEPETPTALDTAEPATEDSEQQQDTLENSELEQTPEELLEPAQEIESEVNEQNQHSEDTSNSSEENQNDGHETHEVDNDDQNIEVAQGEAQLPESDSKPEQDDDLVEESEAQTLEPQEPIESILDTSAINGSDSVAHADCESDEVPTTLDESEAANQPEIQEETTDSNQEEVAPEVVTATEIETLASDVEAEIAQDENSEPQEAEVQETEAETSLATESDLKGKFTEESSNDTPEDPVGEHATPEHPEIGQEALDKDEKVEESKVEQTFALIKPDVYGTNRKEEILQLIEDKKFHIVKSEEVTFSKSLAQEFYNEYKGKHFFDNIITLMSGAPCLAMILEKENVVQEWRNLMGPANSLKAKFESPGSIRALYGTDSIKNAVHGSDSIARAQIEIGLVFNQPAESQNTPKQEEPQSDHQVATESEVDSHLETEVLPSEQGELQPESTVISEQVEPQPENEEILLEQTTPQSENDLASNEVQPQSQDVVTAEAQDSTQETSIPDADAQVSEDTNVENVEDTQRAVKEAPVELQENGVEVSSKTNEVSPEEANPEPENIEDSQVAAAQPQIEAVDQAGNEKAIESQTQPEQTLALIKPDAYGAGNKAAILDTIKNENFSIVKEKEISLTKGQAEEFYKEHAGKPFYDNLVSWMSSQPIYALVLEKNNAIQAWRELIGPTDSIKAKEQHPKSIRALYGTDGSHNAVHGSDSVESANREIKIIFSPSSNPASSNVSQSDVEQTLALIKPDAYGAGRKVSIQKILKKEGFTIVKEKEVRLTRLKAKEFYAEHDGKPFFEKLVSWMSSAPIYAMILRKEGAIKAWRDLMGPTNSVKAKEISPKSIRALYGTDGSKNAVHGSDSFASASREIKIVFGNPDVSNGAKKTTRSPVMRTIPPNGSRATATQAKSRPLSVDASNVKRSVRPSAASATASTTAPKRSSMPPNRRSPTSTEQVKSTAGKDGIKTRAPSTLRAATKPATSTTSRVSAPKPTPTTRVSSIAKKPIESKAAPTQTGANRPIATRPRPSSAASKERSSVVDRLSRPTASSATKSSGEHEAPKTRISKSPVAPKDKVPVKKESTLRTREITKNGSKESISTRTSSRTSTTSSKVGTLPRKVPVPAVKPGTLRSGVKPTGQQRNVKPAGARSARDSQSSKSVTPTESASEPPSVAPSADHSDAETKDDEKDAHSTNIDEVAPAGSSPATDKGVSVETPVADADEDNIKQPEEEPIEPTNNQSAEPPSVSAQ